MSLHSYTHMFTRTHILTYQKFKNSYRYIDMRSLYAIKQINLTKPPTSINILLTFRHPLHICLHMLVHIFNSNANIHSHTFIHTYNTYIHTYTYPRVHTYIFVYSFYSSSLSTWIHIGFSNKRSRMILSIFIKNPSPIHSSKRKYWHLNWIVIFNVSL